MHDHNLPNLLERMDPGIVLFDNDFRVSYGNQALMHLFAETSREEIFDQSLLQRHIDFPIISVGVFEGEPVTWRQGDLFRRAYLPEGRINSYILIGDTRNAGHIHHLYVTREPVAHNIAEILADRRGVSHYRNLMQLQTPLPVR